MCRACQADVRTGALPARQDGQASGEDRSEAEDGTLSHSVTTC
jgi:hypothetical protein